MNKSTLVNSGRQIVLDTETTGMDLSGSLHYQGHKIIEIGAVEVINRRLTGNRFHVYINPKREIDEAAFNVHGISDDFLRDKPVFSEIADDFIRFIDNTELIIHNASFDIGFIDYEFSLMTHDFKVTEHCLVTDTLAIAKRLFPGKRNNLDVLCDRYQIENSQRTLHGALLDAELLAEVYLAMTGGQTLLPFVVGEEDTASEQKSVFKSTKIACAKSKLCVISATGEELASHEKMLSNIDKESGGAIWRKPQ